MSFIHGAHAAGVSHSVDAVAGVSLIAAVAGYLPTLGACIVAVLAPIWYLLQIWESQTVREWRTKRRHHDKPDTATRDSH